MASLRLIVAVLVVGVIAVATDAQALACEIVCASPLGGAVGGQHHGSGPHVATAPHEHHSGSPQPGAVVPHNHDTQGASETGQVQQCVTVNDVSLQAVASRSSLAPLVAVAVAENFCLLPTLDPSSIVAVAGSPPARNGPLQTSSILRI